MLKPYHLFPIILLLSCFSVNAQVRKAYMTADDVQTLDSSKAASYVLIQKMADSGWATYKYDMHDSIMIKGSFKDENLTIPHGKFIYYKLLKPLNSTQYKYNYVTHKMDTIKWFPKNYVSSAGCFLNGKKEGTWIDNDSKMGIHTELNFHDNKLNGSYKEYNSISGTLVTDGAFNNDKQDGRWIEINLEGDTVSITNYKNGIGKNEKIKPHKQHQIVEPKPLYDIIQYLNSELVKTKFTKTGTFYIVYNFVVTNQGKLIEPKAQTPSDLEIDTAIIDKLLACPNWQPATIDGKQISYTIAVNLAITTSKKHPIEISYPFRSDYTKF